MRWSLGTIVAFICLVPPARASDLTVETSVSSARTTPENPRVGSLATLIDGAIDLDDRWAVTLGGLLTVEGATPTAPSSPFPDRGGAIASLSAGVEFRATDNWTFGASLNGSPRSTQHAPTILQVSTATGATADANALLRSTGSSSGLQLRATYDSAGDSGFEWSISGGVAGDHLRSEQQIAAVQGAAGGVATTADIERYCATHACSPELLQALKATPVNLDSTRVSVHGSMTLGHDTDLGLAVDYYAYRQDPSQVGYFSVGSVGRTQIAGGNGVAIAPLRYIVRPEVAHRFGDLALGLWLEGGEYAAGTGGKTSGGGLKAEYRFTRALRMWVSTSSRRDEGVEGDVSIESTVGLGATYGF